jgi:large subunit ribosomal protein L17
MLRNLATSLLRHHRITTTATRAREVSRLAEEMISLARKAHQAAEASDRLAYKRRVFRVVNDRAVAQELFDVLAPRFVDRHGASKSGGYTRVLRVGFRKGDGAPMALIELVQD